MEDSLATIKRVKHRTGEMTQYINTCPTRVRTWVQIARSHRKLEAVAFYRRWEGETKEFLKAHTPLHLICAATKSRNLVSNKVEGKDWDPRLSSELHTHTVTSTCTHTYEHEHTNTSTCIII